MITHCDCHIYLQERIQLETARLYKLARVNPLAGYFYISQTISF